jgi:hypothetical protein
MRDRRLIAAFERAVLVALCLPAAACGGRSEEANPPAPDGGVKPPAAPDAGTDGAPPGACDWQRPSALSPYCNWTFSFTGDPVACAGFTSAQSGTAAECAAACGTDSAGDVASSCYIIDLGAGQHDLYCSVPTSTNCTQQVGIGGRRPEYFASRGFGPAPAGREVGSHFARAACMEAGSVEAFRILRDELRAHGAPARLVRAASRAMRDEMRHVRQTTSLARRYGEDPIPPPAPSPRPQRDLETIARENALEGCVRECYSALECVWQGRVAVDPVVRATMARIARDEMRHMALSWAVHSWAMSRLGADARARVRSKQREELAILTRELARDPVDALVHRAGLPRAWQSRRLIGAIEQRLAS